MAVSAGRPRVTRVSAPLEDGGLSSRCYLEQQAWMFSAACRVEMPAVAAARSTSRSVMLAELPWSSFGWPCPQLAHMPYPFCGR